MVAYEEQVVVVKQRNDIFCRSSTFQYVENDIWEMLVAMNIPNDQVMEKCYDFVCVNPSLVKCLKGMKASCHWNKLYKIMTARVVV